MEGRKGELQFSTSNLKIHGYGVLVFPPSTFLYCGHWNSALGLGHGWMETEGEDRKPHNERKYITWEFNASFPTELTEVVGSVMYPILTVPRY